MPYEHHVTPLNKTASRAAANNHGSSGLSRPAVIPIRKVADDRAINTYANAFLPAAVIQKKDFGLAHSNSIKEFGGQSLAFGTALKSEGVGKLLELATAALHAIFQRNEPNMPLPQIVYDEIDDPLTRGHFVAGTWTVTINKKAYLPNATPAKELPQLMNTLYHEARHCEQYWHAARRLATSMPNNPEGIVKEINVPEYIAIAAIKNKYPGKKQAGREEKARFVVIDGWLKQFQGMGQRARMNSLVTGIDVEKVKVENALNEAKKYLDEHKAKEGAKKDAEYHLYLKQYKDNYDKYRSWAHEDDAWTVGEALENEVIAAQQARIRESLVHFLDFYNSIKKDDEDGLYQNLIGSTLNGKIINQEQLLKDEVERRIIVFKETYERIAGFKEKDGEKYAAIAALLQKSAAQVKEGQMQSAAEIYSEAMAKLNEK